MFHLTILTICIILTFLTCIMTIFSRNTVYSALWMIAFSFVLAVIFLLMHLQFIAVLQIIVYAGAIMMFILYAIMLLNLRYDEGKTILQGLKSVGLIITFIVIIGLLALIGVETGLITEQGGVTLQALKDYGEVNLVAREIFSKYLLPFELISVLLTAGIVGAVALAKKRKTE